MKNRKVLIYVRVVISEVPQPIFLADSHKEIVKLIFALNNVHEYQQVQFGIIKHIQIALTYLQRRLYLVDGLLFLWIDFLRIFVRIHVETHTFVITWRSQ